MFRSYLETMKSWSRKQQAQSFVEKFKISIISIFVGLIFGAIILLSLGYNPFIVYGHLFKGAFKNPAIINRTLIFTSIFTIAGLANAFAFKTGLFNIGVSGQMLAGGSIAIMLGLTTFKNMDPTLVIILMLLISVIVAAMVGLISGALKAYLNVHEVVSTILLNWIIFYFIKYIFRSTQNFVNAAGDSNTINKTMRFGGNTDHSWIFLMILALSAVLIVFLLLKFTVFGKKLSLTGINKDASLYSGINVKLITILSMIISTGLAGLLGFAFYSGHKYFVPRLETTLPQWGYDGIAVALLAFSSPLGIPIISFIYGIFKSGAALSGVEAGIADATISLIFSIIIFSAAASNLFIRFKPYKFFKEWIISLHSEKLKKLIKKRDDEIRALLNKKDISKAEIKIQTKQIKKSFSYKRSEIISELITKKIDLDYKSSWVYIRERVGIFYQDKINKLNYEASQSSNKTSKNGLKSEVSSLKKQKSSELTKLKKHYMESVSKLNDKDIMVKKSMIILGKVVTNDYI